VTSLKNQDHKLLIMQHFIIY